MNIQQMRTLLAVVEAGSFAEASHVVGRSHSAVSLQMKGLEETLGVQLFDRSLRPPKPTRTALSLADHARKILSLYDATDRIVANDAIRGRLRVGAVPTVLGSFLPAAMATLRRLYPDLMLEVVSGSSGDLAGQLSQGTLDVVVCTRPPQPMAGLDWVSLDHEPFVVIAPPGTDGDDEALLTTEPFIWFNRATWAGAGIEAELARRGLSVNAMMEIDSLSAIEQMVREGLGVAIVPVCRGSTGTWKGLRAVPFGTPAFSREIGTLLRQGSAEDPLVKAVLTAL